MKSYSVRVRLFALSIGLLLVLGSANLLLTLMVSQRESQELLQQEQYRRVEVIYGTLQAVGTFRFWRGQVNSAALLDNGNGRSQAQPSLDKAEAELSRRLGELSSFDPVSSQVIQKALSDFAAAAERFLSAVRERREDQSKAAFTEGSQLLTIIEKTLAEATKREHDLAQVAQQLALKRAHAAIRWSWLIMLVSAVLSLGGAWVVLRSITGPLKSTVRAMRQVNAGETEIDLPPIGSDEFGDMAVALRQFRDQADRLRRLAYQDSLTGLGTRAQLEDELRAGIETCQSEASHLVLFYVDLDNFSAVNDSLGHSAGDRYLCEAAFRLQRFVPDEAVICRYSGDKFTVMLGGLRESGSALQEKLRELADLILRGLSEPFQLGGNLLPMSVSVGVAQFPLDGETGEQLLSSADAAMYRAKRNGRNNAQFASAEQTAKVRRELTVATDIRRGIENSEFEPYYQPIVDIERSVVTGAEALLRWRHPHRGIVGANEFIEVAEATGMIRALGEACLLRAFDQARSWSAQGRQIRVAVNLSVRQIDDRSVITLLEKLNATRGEFVDGLDLEITESTMLEHLERAQETLHRVKALGYRLSVDDFGTGYSSLTYVQKFPIDKIKIDRSFVVRIETSREAQAIVSATLALAKSLDLEVIAEGVETQGQQQRLRELGCTLQQGYLYSRALPVPEFEAWANQYELQARAI